MPPSISQAREVGGLVDHLFRHQAGQMVSTLTRIFGPQNLGLAEEVVQEALLKALQQWPYRGLPDNPAGWLFQVAKNRALDLLRRDASLREKSGELLAMAATAPRPNGSSAASGDGDLADDELSMMFMTCHPALTREARVALTLKTVGGFSVGEIARSFLAREPSIAQRLVRAKRQIRREQIPFEMPPAAELCSRLDSVLEVLYLMFNEGYAAHQGQDLVRADLCQEAIRLGRLVAGHPATELPEAHALLALMLLQASRIPARVDQGGDLFLLGEQDRLLWDRRWIQEGLRSLGKCAEGGRLTEYHLQAGIAAVHAVAPSFEATDWARIVELYGRLMEVAPSPVVGLNRAVAVSRCRGPRAGVAARERIKAPPPLKRYYLLPATMGGLWRELEDYKKAAACYRRALECPCSAPEERFLRKKLASLD